MRSTIFKKTIPMIFMGLYLVLVIIIFSQMRIQHFLSYYILNYISYFFPLIVGVALMCVKNKKACEIVSIIMLVICIIILAMRIMVPYATESATYYEFFGRKLSIKERGLFGFVCSWASMNSIGTSAITRSIVHFLSKPDVVRLVLMNYILPCISTVLMGVVFVLLYKGTENESAEETKAKAKKIGKVLIGVAIAMVLIFVVHSCGNGNNNNDDYPRGFEKCFTCKGSGMVNEGFLDFEKCPTCRGSGMLDSH